MNTAIEPNESEPKYIIFEITDDGVKKQDTKLEDKKLKAAISVASSAIIKKPWAR